MRRPYQRTTTKARLQGPVGVGDDNDSGSPERGPGAVVASASPRIARRAISAWVAAISLVGISPAFFDLTALDERAPVPGMHGVAPSLQPRGDLTSPLGPPSPSEGVALTPAPSSSPPSRLYDASTFGARGDGQTNDTAAIQAGKSVV